MSSPFELTSHHGARPQIKTITWEIPRETIQLTLLNSQTVRYFAVPSDQNTGSNPFLSKNFMLTLDFHEAFLCPYDHLPSLIFVFALVNSCCYLYLTVLTRILDV